MTEPNHVHEVDAVLGRMFKSIPNEPFIVSIASDPPYRRAGPEKLKWRDKTHFEDDEEYLQYATFMTRPIGDSMLYMRPHRKREPPTTANLTPSWNPKKKISLADYRGKAKQDGTPRSNDLQEDRNADSARANSEQPRSQSIISFPDDLASNERASRHQSPQYVDPGSVGGKNGDTHAEGQNTHDGELASAEHQLSTSQCSLDMNRKRSFEEYKSDSKIQEHVPQTDRATKRSDEHYPNVSAEPRSPPSSSNLSKRSKIESPKKGKKHKSNHQETERDVQRSVELDAQEDVSFVEPGSKKGHHLAPEHLKRVKTQRSKSGQSTPGHVSGSQKPPTRTNMEDLPDFVQLEKTYKNEYIPWIPSIDSTRPKVNLSRRITPLSSGDPSPGPDSLLMSGLTSVTSSSSLSITLDLPSQEWWKQRSLRVQPPTRRDSLIVKLRVGKALQRQGHKLNGTASEVGRIGQNGTPSSIRNTEHKTAKRARQNNDEDLPEHASKRSRTSPSTPTKSAKSQIHRNTNVVTPNHPSLASATTRKHLTPSSAAKSALNGVLASTSAASTPRGPSLTPSGGTQETLSAHGSPRPKGISDEWKEEYRRLEDLGKVLKRDFDSTSQAAKDERDRRKAKGLTRQAIMQGVESTLSFMQGFCALDQARPGFTNSWRSLDALLETVKHRARDEEHIRGICYTLEAAQYNTLASLMGSVNMGADASEAADKKLQLLTQLQKSLKRAQVAAQEAERLLPRESLAKDYKGAYQETMSWRLSAAPKAMEVIRMVKVFMGEWCGRFGVAWEMRLDEGSCETL